MALHEYMLSAEHASQRPLAVLLRERRFLPGERIVGKVRINAVEALNAYSVFVLVRGLEQASEGFHAVGGAMHEQNFSIFLHHRQYVVPAQEPPADKPLDVLPLGRGAHLFDFCVDLPKNIPPSFKLDSWASVRYTITAYLQIVQLAGKPVAESEYSEPTEFLVVGSAKEVVEDRMRRAEPQQGTAVAQIGFGGDTVKLQVKLDRDAFVMGEEAKVRVTLNNHTSRTVKQGQIALHQRLITTEQSAGVGAKQTREVLLASVVERPMPILVNAQSGFESAYSFTIPSPSHRVKFVCCPSLVGRLFSLEHYLVVTVYVTGPLGLGSTEVTARLHIRLVVGHAASPSVSASVVGFDQCVDPRKTTPVNPGQLYDKTYTLYSIMVRSGEQTWRVQRRYSEFDALRQRLSEEFDAVPALPPKRPLAKVDPSFLVSRQEALDEFLRRSTRHPDIGNCHTLLHFLGVETFTAYSSPSAATGTPAIPASGSAPMPVSAAAAAAPPASAASPTDTTPESAQEKPPAGDAAPRATESETLL